jgi:hypothetical protein
VPGAAVFVAAAAVLAPNEATPTSAMSTTLSGIANFCITALAYIFLHYSDISGGNQAAFRAETGNFLWWRGNFRVVMSAFLVV